MTDKFFVEDESLATKDIALSIVNMMSEEQLQSYVNLFQGIISDIPNDETVSAMQEAEEMLKDPDAVRFNSVDDLFAELRE